MKYQKILITGGAGFVGSNLALRFKKEYPKAEIIALDNLKRRGSELNLPRLRRGGVKFIHGDVRNKEDLDISGVELLIECSAEPSVLAGINSPPDYLINTNLFGAVNCFELARKNKADVIFLSTSRVYPISYLNRIKITETEVRFLIDGQQELKGVSKEGISEDFPLDDTRSLYGTTKLSAELLLQEYIAAYGIKGVINRCGLLTGPWQMGKIDQGVVVYWLAAHFFKKKLNYIGFGGQGKQVRDILHVDDLFSLLRIQLKDLNKFNAQVYNVGGGFQNSLSLRELTDWCRKLTGNKIPIDSIKENRQVDVKVYISNNQKIQKASGWLPKKGIAETLVEINQWLTTNKKELEEVFF